MKHPPRSKSPKRVVVTGGTGYIGRALTAHLVQGGFEVTVLTRQELESTSSIHNTRIDASIESVVRALEMARPDVVVHLAASYARIHEPGDVSSLVQSNVLFGTMISQAMAQVGVANLVLAGSHFQFTGRREGEARSLYGATKNAFERIVDYYESIGSFRAIRLIICDVYGEDDPRGRLLNVLADAARSGAAINLPVEDVYVAPVHISDVVRSIEIAIQGTFSPGRYWVGPAEPVLVRDLVRLVEQISGATIRVETVGLPTLPGDNRPGVFGRALPGWRPEVSLEEGIVRLLGAA
jgi:nucleoside-diphosphate-sugar epimerase